MIDANDTHGRLALTGADGTVWSIALDEPVYGGLTADGEAIVDFGPAYLLLTGDAVEAWIRELRTARAQLALDADRETRGA